MLREQLQTHKNANRITHPNSHDTLGLTGYCFRLVPEQFPETRIRCNGYGYVEPYEALKVSLQGGENTICSMGIVNATNK